MNWLKPSRTTGVGSLPHCHPSRALPLIVDSAPCWPHWPQLPAGGPEQAFVLQYVQPLIKLGLLEFHFPRDPVFTRNSPDWEEKLVRFYDLYLRFGENDPEAADFFQLDGDAFIGLNAFLDDFSRLFPQAEGVKGHLSGPLTVGLQIKDERGRACFYDDGLRDILVKCLAVQGILQVRRLASLGKPVLLFIDDPSMYLIGAATHITLTKELISDAIGEMISAFRHEGARVGVHACSQMDWTILFDLRVDVVSFDAFHFFDSMVIQTEGLAKFLAQGGKLAWGLVPTSEEAWEVNIDGLAALFASQRDQLARRGIAADLLGASILWTPSCGTGALSIELAEQVYQLLGQCPQIPLL